MHLQEDSLLSLLYSGGKFNMQLSKTDWMVAQRRGSALLFACSDSGITALRGI